MVMGYFPTCSKLWPSRTQTASNGLMMRTGGLDPATPDSTEGCSQAQDAPAMQMSHPFTDPSSLPSLSTNTACQSLSVTLARRLCEHTAP